MGRCYDTYNGKQPAWRERPAIHCKNGCRSVFQLWHWYDFLEDSTLHKIIVFLSKHSPSLRAYKPIFVVAICQYSHRLSPKIDSYAYLVSKHHRNPRMHIPAVTFVCNKLPSSPKYFDDTVQACPNMSVWHLNTNTLNRTQWFKLKTIQTIHS